jgi:hypothetical protein
MDLSAVPNIFPATQKYNFWSSFLVTLQKHSQLVNAPYIT